MKIASSICALAMAFTIGCGVAPQEDQQSQETDQLDQTQQRKLGPTPSEESHNGQCCKGYCVENSVRVGEKWVTENCHEAIVALCHSFGYHFQNAYWGACEDRTTYWL